MLRTDSIAIVPLREADRPILYEWINDRDTALNNAPYQPISLETHAAWFASVQRTSDLVIFGIRRRADDVLIGSCQLRAIHRVHRNAELQIRIGDVASRGRGLGTQAVKLLLVHGFRDLNLERVYLSVFATNEAALRLYTKVGFVEEGRMRRGAFIDGQYVDVVGMGLLRGEWHV